MAAPGVPRPEAPAPGNPRPAAAPPRAHRPAAVAVTAAAALVALAVLAGCAGRGAAAAGPADAAGAKTPDRAVSAAADALVRAGSARVTTSMRMASGGTWLTISGTGGFDFAHRRGRLTLRLPDDAAGRPEHGPITELLTPGALYMKNRGAGVPAGKWVRMDTTRLPDGNLVTGGATGPLAAAELLRGAQHVSYVGEQTLRGVRVRHYRGTADIAAAARAADPASRAPLAAAARGFTETRVPFDAWLDGQGRLRQLSQRFTFGAATGTKQGAGRRSVTVVSTTSYDAFGTPVPVSLPRPADIWSGKIVPPGSR